MKKYFWITIFYFSLLLTCNGCMKAEKNATMESTTEENVPDYYHTEQKFIPKADQTEVRENEDVQYDISNVDQGYLIVQKKTEADIILIQVTGKDQITYNYYIKEKMATLPLTAGNGEYQVTTYINLGEAQYMMSFSEVISVSLENEVIPFLYPSQYVNFNDSMKAITLAGQLTKNKSETEAITEIYKYVIRHIKYDYEKAETVERGYLPVIDQILQEKKGICFDYAALMTSMLRSQGIPTRLDIGYNAQVYHAWISVYLKEKGWVNNVVEFNGEHWNLVDPTLASVEGKSENDYKVNGEDYTLEYTH